MIQRSYLLLEWIKGLLLECAEGQATYATGDDRLGEDNCRDQVFSLFRPLDLTTATPVSG
jgi:hypothetical protein